MSQKKSILEQMYEAVMENGGPTGPISKAVVDSFEGTKVFKKREKKVVISFLKKSNIKNNYEDC